VRIVIVGLGSAGIKRQLSIGIECIATVDTADLNANYQTLQEIPINSYDAVFICTANEQKYNLARYALVNKKHILIEKPLLGVKTPHLQELEHLARANKVVAYVASSYRFEPYIIRTKQILDSEVLGEIYHCRLSLSDNAASFVLDELGHDALWLLHYFFGNKLENKNLTIISKKSNRNIVPDHVIFADFSVGFALEVEISSLPWQNKFCCEIIAANGEIHVDSLSKWGASSFLYLQRSLDAENVIKENETLVQSDPTLDLEYAYFKYLCLNPQQSVAFSSETWINEEIERLSSEEILIA